jgi:hypothetical protein
MMIAQLFRTISSHDAPTVDNQLTSRRQVLTVVGIGTTVALAGCSSNGQGDSQPEGSDGDSTEQDDGSNSGESDPDNSDGSEETENEPGEYSEQNNEGLMEKLDNVAAGQEGVYAFRIDDQSYLKIEDFPNIADEFPNQSNFQELAGSSTTIEGYEKALYVAVNMDPSWAESDDIYFYSTNPELTEGPVINMYKNAENNPGDPNEFATDGDGVAVGYPPEGGIGVEPEQGKEYQAEFFRNHIDPDGIVHAVDLAEHDYAVDALHSGFGSE